MCPIWKWLDTCVTVANLGSQRCWFLNSFAQFRDHGGLKRGVQRFSSDPLWWWQCVLPTQAKVWGCIRLASRASSKYFEKDVARDLVVELVMMCTDENNMEEFMGICYLLCWQGYDKDPGGNKKMMWSILHLVRVRKRKRKCLHAQALEPRKGGGDIAAGLNHRTDDTRWWKFHPQWREDMGNMRPLPHLCKDTGGRANK